MRIILLILVVTLASCSFIKDAVTPSNLTWKEKRELAKKDKANKKLEKLTKKYPFLLDSVSDTTTVYSVVDSTSIHQSFQQDTNVSQVDSIIARYEGLLDSDSTVSSHMRDSLLHLLGSDIKRYIIERPCLPEKVGFDTVLTLMIDGKPYEIPINTSAQSNKEGQIVLGIEVPKTEFKTEIVEKDVHISPEEKTTKEYLYQIWRDFWWILILVLGLIVLRWFISKR